MKYLRSLLVAFSFLFFGIGASFINFILLPVKKIFLSEKDFIYYSSEVISGNWRKFIKFLEFIKIIKINIQDKQVFNDIKNKIVVSTHPTYIDILILIALMPKSTCFVKKELTKNFILKNIVNSIFIPNNLTVEEMLEQGKKYLDLGFNLIIFPMGKRHKKDEHPKIKKGAASIALYADKDIVPLQILISEDFLPADEPFYKGGNNTVEFNFKILNEIQTEKFKDKNPIIMKRNITEEISKLLYE